MIFFNKYTVSILVIMIASLAYLTNNENNKNIILSSNDFDSLIPKTKSEKLIGYKIQISIENGCGKYGIAKLYTNFLRKKGYDVIDFKNADNFDYENTQLIFHNRNYSAYSNEIADLLKINPKYIKYNFDENIYYHATLILGKDYNKIDSFDEVSMFYEPF